MPESEWCKITVKDPFAADHGQQCLSTLLWMQQKWERRVHGSARIGSSQRAEVSKRINACELHLTCQEKQNKKSYLCGKFHVIAALGPINGIQRGWWRVGGGKRRARESRMSKIELWRGKEEIVENKELEGADTLNIKRKDTTGSQENDRDHLEKWGRPLHTYTWMLAKGFLCLNMIPWTKTFRHSWPKGSMLPCLSLHCIVLCPERSHTCLIDWQGEIKRWW